MDIYIVTWSLMTSLQIFRCNGFRSDNEISYIPGLTFLAPYVSDQTARVETKLKVICKVRSETIPDIQWLRRVGNGINSNGTVVIDGMIFRPVQHVTRYFEGKSQRFVRTLVIRRAKVTDSGLYACRISNNEDSIVMKYNIQIRDDDVIPVRLMSFSSLSEGRVEVYRQDGWGTICHYGFEIPEASVICGMLGYQNGGIPRLLTDRKRLFRSKLRRYRVFMQQIRCPFNATHIGDCAPSEADKRLCSDYYDAGVTCSNETVIVPTEQIKFEGGAPEEGVVEVYKGGHWGTICSSGISQNEVNTICRMMGYQYGGKQYTLENPILGKKPMWIHNLSCPPDAYDLKQCRYMGRPTFCLDFDCECSHRSDLFIDCKKTADEDDPTKRVRLAASNEDHQGRVEVYHDGVWGTVSAYWLGNEGANVICKMLGYQYGGVPYLDAPPGNGKIWIKYMDCPLVASDLSECNVDWGNTEYATHNADVGVTCRSVPVEVPIIPFRLMGWKNKLNYFRDGYWGPVCGAYMGTPEATMFCNMLGYGFGGHASLNSDSWSRYSSDTSTMLLSYLDCPFNVSSLDDCGHRGFGLPDIRPSCGRMDHAKDVEIQCRTEPFTDIPVRITGGPSEREGIIEAYVDGIWGNICDNSLFDPQELSVICKQQGFRKGGEILNSKALGFPNELSGNFLYKLECSGKEPTIGHCNDVQKRGYCSSYTEIVTAKCHKDDLSDANWTVSLRNESSTEAGVVVVSYNDALWYICPKWWDNVHANATCAMLGYRGGTATYIDTVSTTSNEPMKTISMFYCDRGVKSLKECYHTNWSDSACDTRRYRAGVTCY